MPPARSTPKSDFAGPVGRSLALGVALCCLLLVTGRTHAAENRVSLPQSVGTIRADVAATRRALNAKDLASPLNFSVALQMRDFAGLQARVARGETFSRTELEQRYLPLRSDYEAVKAWALSQGLTLRGEDDSRLNVFLRGSVSQVQSSLQVSMVKVTSEGMDYPAADSEPSLPVSIAGVVVGVNGLHPYHHLHRHIKKRPRVTPAATSTSVTYTVPQILSIYDATNLGVTGANQTIAILIDATPLKSDLTSFYANNQVAASANNVTTINVNDTTITSTEEEETLDVEWSSGVAPGAKIRVYATGDLDDASLDRGLARILSDTATDATIHQLSISLGGGETFNTTAQFTTDAQYFAALASQGVSTFVSAGDDGSTPAGPSGSDTLQVEYYSSDPSVTAVGGTAVRVDSTYTYDASTAETVWGPYTTTNGATGGGVSIAFKKPSWQTGTGVPTGTMRYTPDVAMPADPYTGAYIYYKGAASDIGGTSWSAPTWAGFCALINEARANAGQTRGIGLLNPSVYPLIGTTNFHDIKVGNNILDASVASGKYSATAGYDECTGVGTPDLKVLLNTLVANGTTATVQPTITGISPTSGTVGTTVTITGTNFTNAQTVGFFSQPGNDGGTTFTVNSSTQITVVVPAAAQTGPITVTTSGATVSSGTFTFTPSSTAPTITSFTPTSGTPGYITYDANGNGTVHNGTKVTITGTNFTGATEVTFDGVATDDYATPFTVVSATSITTYVAVDAITGPLTVTTAKGKAVSAGTFTASSTASVNAPTVTGFTPASGTAGTTSVVITGTGFTQATAVKFNGTAATVLAVNSDTQITATVPTNATTGPISVTDSTGTGTSTGSFTVGGTTVSPPTVTGFTPTSGAVGTSVTVTGTNLSSPTAVSFGGTAASAFSSSSSTQITATVPTGAASGVISVTTAGGTTMSSATFTVTTSGTSAPTIASFTPISGPVGTSVIITGTNLTGATAVAFGATAATAFTVNSATQITATVPAGAATGTISVTTAGGTVASTGTFTVTTTGGGGTTATTVVISQVYGGSSSISSTYQNDFIELFNPTNAAVDLTNYSVQYGKATGTTAFTGLTKLSGSIQSQHYYLVQEITGSGTTALPTPDATGTIDLSGTTGKVALVSNQTAVTGSTSAGVVDFVGYGSSANDYEGTSGPAPAPSTTTADLRLNGGYTDTNNNLNDFTAGTPNPRNHTVSNTTAAAPDLTVSLSHTGNFTQADAGDTYTVTVGNAGTAATTGTTVTVTDTLPGGLTATGLSGTGWTPAANHLSATRTDALAAGSSYPALTLTVSVSSTAASSVTNVATVSGGGETNTGNDSASDPTTITALTPSQSWRYQYFGTTANAGNAADTANPTGDGLPNLLKYALGLDPTVPTPSPVTVDVSTGYLRLTTPKNPNATDVTVVVQVSGTLSDPSSWSTSETTIDQNTPTLLQVQDAMAVSQSSARFLRLTVTR